MPDLNEFTDNTDWLPTPLAALAPFDSSLRCQVCKDFFTTPMMTSCSHTFCSLCIRRYLSHEGRCPVCRESDQEIKLRRNWAVEELVAIFTASRKGLLAFATYSAEQAKAQDDIVTESRPKKRRKVEPAHAPDVVERRSTRSQSRRMITTTSSQQSAGATQEVIEDSESEDSIYEEIRAGIRAYAQQPTATKEPGDGQVECPCCHRRMKETLINSHLDKCIQGDSYTPVDDRNSSPMLSNGGQIAPPGTIAYSQPKPSKQNERLPFINYSLYTETKLRNKLKELGLSNHGSKDLMQKRHTEWVNLWNANCDSTTPVTKRELLRELKVWEDTQGRQLERPTSNSGFMAKDFDRDRHVRKQKDNFDDLIRQAREKARAKADTSGKTDTPAEVGTAGTDVAIDDSGNLYAAKPQTDSNPTRAHDIQKEEARFTPPTNHVEDSAAVKYPDEMLNGNSVEAGIDVKSPKPSSNSALTVQNGLDTAPPTPSRRFFV